MAEEEEKPYRHASSMNWEWNRRGEKGRSRVQTWQGRDKEGERGRRMSGGFLHSLESMGRCVLWIKERVSLILSLEARSLTRGTVNVWLGVECYLNLFTFPFACRFHYVHQWQLFFFLEIKENKLSPLLPHVQCSHMKSSDIKIIQLTKKR